MLTDTTNFQRNLWPQGSGHVFNAKQKDSIEASRKDNTEAAVAQYHGSLHATQATRACHIYIAKPTLLRR